MQIANGLGPPARVRVWDGPQRTCHVLIVLSLAGAVGTAADDAWAPEHLAFELIAALLVGFRMAWASWGCPYARWQHLLHRPRAIARSLFTLASRRGELFPTDPLRGTLHLLLLMATLAIGATGLAAELEAVYDWVHHAHGASYGLLWVALGLHLVVVAAASIVYRDNLLLAMWSGTYVAPAHEAIRDPRRGVSLALALGAIGGWAVLAHSGVL
ncbi:cytochrome b/b6 domain-containing protein [Ramlibacter algicola]|uniref:Cytochrome b/b6 domain-containing protein n=1 Tax=Ramlibacter algicola TaxID=2795217 RepID=A0A934Q5R4_9BURK|nr:cytochrome b/b6 domain-containing protein [Ramlibacter algicola]